MTEQVTDTKDTATKAQTAGKAAKEEAAKQPTLKEVIRQQAADEDTPLSGSLSLGKILGGDILTTSAIRRQIWLVLLIVVFVIMYISNRYSCQQSLIEIDKLQKELQDAKYKSQATNNCLTEMSRESRVLEMLNDCKDSTLHMPTQPPYLITIPDNK